MRNILQYPITNDEMLQAIDRAIEDNRKSEIAFGSIQGVALKTARDKLAELLKLSN